MQLIATPRPRTRVLIFLLAILAAAAISSVQASRVRPVNLEEMTSRAERILSGECVAFEVASDPELGIDVAQVTLRVARAVKGEAAGTVTVRMPAGAEQSSGLPRFTPGEEVILFLYGESASGLTSPVGLGQGKFTVLEDKQGRRMAVNAFGNRTLFRRLSPEALTRLGDQAGQLKEREGITPSALLDMVESLVR